MDSNMRQMEDLQDAQPDPMLAELSAEEER